MAAVIEARSHERLALLGVHCPEKELRALYQGLAEAEARHWSLYMDLAVHYFAEEVVTERLSVLLEAEGNILATTYQPGQLDPPPRIHS